jgi:bacterioferritin
MNIQQASKALRLQPSDVRRSRDGFVSTMESIATRTRLQLHDTSGAQGLHADRDRVVALLNAALALGIVCVLRYRRHYFAASGAYAQTIKKGFLRHSQEEQAHADGLAERIIQLGGKPRFNPDGLIEHALTECGDIGGLEQMIGDDLAAETVAIESYREIIRFVEDRDYTTRRLLEAILSAKEQHAEELTCLLGDLRRMTRSAASRSADRGMEHMVASMCTA